MTWLAFLLAGVMLPVGFEMFLVIGVPTLLIKETYFSSMPAVVLVQKMVGGIDHAVLLAIPFYIFGADLMSEGRQAYLLSRVRSHSRRRGTRLRRFVYDIRFGVRFGAGNGRGTRPNYVSAAQRSGFP